MHELPKDLSNSLRSYRGSIYSANRRGDNDVSNADRDLEKGPAEDWEKPHVDPKQSSIIIHPTKSNQALNKARQEHGNHKQEQNSQSQLQTKRNSQQRPTIDTKVQPSQSHPTDQEHGMISVIEGPPVKDVDPAAARLAENDTPLSHDDFYMLMGIYPPDEVNSDASLKKLAVPHGLLHNIVTTLSYTNTKYHAFAIAVYVFLTLQLLISAVFIILGAIRTDSHISIAALGAVSTVIAGSLGLMQGQGLPNRLRITRDGLKDVVLAAEELYWDARTGRPILYEDIKKIREDYLKVLEEQKRNRPDAWNPLSKSLAEPISSRKSARGVVPARKA